MEATVTLPLSNFQAMEHDIENLETLLFRIDTALKRIRNQTKEDLLAELERIESDDALARLSRMGIPR
jgi:hypothetical protein